jgi:hypothetical protein
MPRRAPVVVLALMVFALTGCGGSATPSSSPPGATPRTVAGGNGRLSTATVDVVNGTSTVWVSARSLGGALYRVSTPRGSGIHPLVTVHGTTVQIGTASSGPQTAVASLVVTLANSVRWSINLNGGANTEHVDMRGGSVSSLDFGAGVSDASVDLPAPVGTATVTLTGGASRLVVLAPPGPPARVTAGGGASRVLLDGFNHTGVAGGSVFTDPGWASADDRYGIDLTAGVSDFQMTRS